MLQSELAGLKLCAAETTGSYLKCSAQLAKDAISESIALPQKASVCTTAADVIHVQIPSAAECPSIMAHYSFASYNGKCMLCLSLSLHLCWPFEAIKKNFVRKHKRKWILMLLKAHTYSDLLPHFKNAEVHTLWTTWDAYSPTEWEAKILQNVNFSTALHAAFGPRILDKGIIMCAIFYANLYSSTYALEIRMTLIMFTSEL